MPDRQSPPPPPSTPSEGERELVARPPYAGQVSRPYQRLSDTQLPTMTPGYPGSPLATPQLSRRDPSLPTIVTTSHAVPHTPAEGDELPWKTKVGRYIYDKEEKSCCGRTAISWAQIITYSIMYIVFLATYTMVFLFIALLYIKRTTGDPYQESYEPLLYSPSSIGLSGTPLSEHNYPLIWYRNGESVDYDKYLRAIDELLEEKPALRNHGKHLGPCGKRPYGYGDRPCILVRVNKQKNWAAKPLRPDSPEVKEVPEEVQKWIQKDSNKYWLHCSGYHSYDKDHIGKIWYYPDPPGFDAALFPLDINSPSPLIAVQVSNFTLGISLAIECTMYYETGTSRVAFMLYVSPKGKTVRKSGL